MTLLEQYALRVALRHWREKLQRRYGWRAADDAYVRHNAICCGILPGKED